MEDALSFYVSYFRLRFCTICRLIAEVAIPLLIFVCYALPYRNLISEFIHSLLHL